MEFIVLLAIGWLGWKYIKRKPHNSVEHLVAEYSRLIHEKREKIELQGIPYIPDNKEEGIFQIVNFPYQTYEEWYAVYTNAAIENNPSLEPTLTSDGKKMSLMDFLDDEPCRRAYKHHLHPEILGRKFGETFDPLNVGFADGSTTHELIAELKSKGEI